MRLVCFSKECGFTQAFLCDSGEGSGLFSQRVDDLGVGLIHPVDH